MFFVLLEISNIECCDIRKWRTKLNCDYEFRESCWNFCYCCYHCYCCCCCCDWNCDCNDDDVEFEYCFCLCLSLFRFRKKDIVISSCSKLSNWRKFLSFKQLILLFVYTFNLIYIWFFYDSATIVAFRYKFVYRIYHTFNKRITTFFTMMACFRKIQKSIDRLNKLTKDTIIICEFIWIKMISK